MSRPRNNDPDSSKGLYHKFRVERLNPSTRHENCRYFVLDIDHDGFAPQALKAYADACYEEYPLLAKDISAALAGDKSVFANFDNDLEGCTNEAGAADVEKLAAVIYERAFDCQWDQCTGAERALWLEVAEAVRRSLQPPRPQAWISVEERLPEKGKYVLAFEPSGGIFIGFNMSLSWCDARGITRSHEQITHWRPLPEPPRPAKEKA